jgi:hypothetical protein
MVSSFHHEKKSIVISEVHTVARAEFIQVTLAAHGITATLTPSSIYPSIDFVEGRGIAVQLEDEGRARQVLESLGLAGDPPPAESNP